MLHFRKLSTSDYDQWRALWQGYLEFYRQELSEEQTQLTWSRFFDDEYNLMGFVIEVDGKLAGLAHCSFTNSTWLQKPDLYLEDLFVAPEFRRRGFGEKLILECSAVAKAAGARRLYWQTQRSNESAQALYRKVGTLSEFIVFENVF
jgi:ribosomal protein S18 acetylase RimI-like enzyme